jgi:hypothetical protein
MDLGQEFPGSPSSLDLRIARGEAVVSDMAEGTELREFGSDSERDRDRDRGDIRSHVSFDLDNDADYDNNANDTTGSDVSENTILGTSRRLLGRALAQSHAGFGMRKNTSFEVPPPKSRSEMRISDLESSSSQVQSRRASLPPIGM